jgi:hypothetical protein
VFLLKLQAGQSVMALSAKNTGIYGSNEHGFLTAH